MFSEPFERLIAPSVLRHSASKSSEQARLAALRGSRAYEPNLRPALDRVASCVGMTLQAPLAAVSVVEADAVVFAGVHGLDRRRTERRGSFCDAVVQLGTTLLTADATVDRRFHDHEFVTQGQVRSYAGAPVMTEDGEVLGAVCAFAGEVDAFRPDCLPDLEALAHMVELLLLSSELPEPALPQRRRQGWLGVRTLDAHRAGAAARSGLVVLSVAKRSPADEAGIRTADILHAVDDHVLRERADLVATLADRELGSAVRVTFQRSGQWMERWVKVAPRRAG